MKRPAKEAGLFFISPNTNSSLGICLLCNMLKEEDILYCDNHLLIINKKPSQVVQADKTGDESLQEMAKQYLKSKFDKPGEVYLGIVHRIDRPVSGVLIFARTSKAAARISEAFREKKVQKT